MRPHQLTNRAPDPDCPACQEEAERRQAGDDVEPSWPEQMADEMAERMAEGGWRWAR